MIIEHKVTLLVPITVVVKSEPVELPQLQYLAERLARSSIRYPASLAEGPIVLQAMSVGEIKK